MKNNSAPRAQKKWGQHYLKDQKVISAITQNFAATASAVLEIGPGPGALTRELAKSGPPLAVIDIDQRFFPQLQQYLRPEQMLLADAMEIDLAQTLQNFFPGENNIWLVSNLPYNVSAPLLVKFLQIPQISSMTLMFQKEVADKIIFQQLAKGEANSLGVLAHNFFSCQRLLAVKPGAFHPPPKVDSTVISFQRRQAIVPLAEFKSWEAFLRGLFSRPRKQLKNVFQCEFHMDLPVDVDPKIRAEKLSLEQIFALYRHQQKKL